MTSLLSSIRGGNPAVRDRRGRGPTPSRTEAVQAMSLASSLRLVRFRLALAIVAAAVLPASLLAPFAFQLGQEIQARGGPAESSIAASRLDLRLDGLRAELLETATRDALSGRVRVEAAVEQLDVLASTAPGIVTGAWLLAPDGAELAASGIRPQGRAADPLPGADAAAAAAALLEIESGAAVASVARDPAGTVLYLGVPLDGPASAADRNLLLARVSLPALLGEAEAGLRGRVVIANGPVGSAGLIGRTAAVEAASASFVAGDHLTADDRTRLAASGFEGWSVLVVPAPLTMGLPRPLIGLVAGLTLATLLLILWLARQVIRPAQQLETTQTRLRELYETARSDALEDALTGLGNHRAFMEEFERRIEESRRHEEDLALLLIDLDDFKLVNDSAGHAAGDKLLIELGRLLGSVLRRTDRAYRIGGDEFAVLMPHTDAASALVVARRLLALCTEPRRESVFPRPFTFTGGISGCPEFSTSRGELFAQADAALYDGKRHGRTTVNVFDPQRAKGMIDQATRADLSAKVARVVSERSLRPVFQPVVDLATGRVIGFEGLVRPTADAPFDNPGALFAAAEAGGRTTELDFACIETVLTGFGGLAPDQSLSINLSPRSLEAAEFNTGSLLQLLGRHRADPRRITIELTEREAVEDIDRLRAVIASCQAAGFRIAVDDVGAGNAGLRLLSQIHFDIVKIDLSLVQDGEQRETSLAVLRALTELAARWGAMVVAEGVETASQLATIQALGMAAAQGYLLGRPADEPTARYVDLAALLSAGTPSGGPFARSAGPAAGQRIGAGPSAGSSAGSNAAPAPAS